mmetsp:Transcript_36286/g.87571  ORF Transcript_36286/g.87571 Transcript_36286/m.87571 type:complete len:105 (+) Transcript_36286:632-946(+)
MLVVVAVVARESLSSPLCQGRLPQAPPPIMAPDIALAGSPSCCVSKSIERQEMWDENCGRKSVRPFRPNEYCHSFQSSSVLSRDKNDDEGKGCCRGSVGDGTIA